MFCLAFFLNHCECVLQDLWCVLWVVSLNLSNSGQSVRSVNGYNPRTEFMSAHLPAVLNWPRFAPVRHGSLCVSPILSDTPTAYLSRKSQTSQKMTLTPRNSNLVGKKRQGVCRWRNKKCSRMVQQMPWGRKDPQCQPLVHHTLALVILPLRCLTHCCSIPS